MNKIKTILPELYLSGLFLLASYSPPFHFNFFFLIISLIVILQLFLKNRILGLVIGSLFLLLNLFFLAALLSEF
ncbi:MAG: hypothetical protein AAGH46_10570, partial [Bacteroidota bacterium]